MTHVCFDKINCHWFRQWLITWLALCIDLLFDHGEQIKSNDIRIQISNLFVCKMATILSRSQCVNWSPQKRMWWRHLSHKSYQPVLISYDYCLSSNVKTSYSKLCIQRSLSRVTLYTAGHLHTAVPHCSHSRAPIVHTAVSQENNEHGCVFLRGRSVCKLPGCVEGHPCR